MHIPEGHCTVATAGSRSPELAQVLLCREGMTPLLHQKVTIDPTEVLEKLAMTNGKGLPQSTV